MGENHGYIVTNFELNKYNSANDNALMKGIIIIIIIIIIYNNNNNFNYNKL